MAALNEEQSIIRDQARAWVAEQAPVRKFREMRDQGVPTCFLPETWSTMIDMGWPGIIIPEQYGGSGLGYLTFGLVLEEIGRHLTASPLFASGLVGASTLLLGGSDAQKMSWLPRVADGTAILTLALEEGPRHAPYVVALEARRRGKGFVLNGTKSFVHEGMAATAMVVAARTKGWVGERAGITLFLVPADHAGVSLQQLQTVDSRGYAHVIFENVSVDDAAILGAVDEGGAILDATLDRACAGIGAEMMGSAAQAFDMTLTYLKTRVQFGQVIGAFQALGHRAASLFSEMELARSCVEAALQAIDDDADDVAELCSLSKCRAGEFLHHMSNELIQIHGGIGMTDDFDAGFYLKRARALEFAFGNQAYHRNRYATLLGF